MAKTAEMEYNGRIEDAEASLLAHIAGVLGKFFPALVRLSRHVTWI
jgi:hypothetical protein